MRTVATIDQIQCTVEVTACVNKIHSGNGIDQACWHSSRRYILKDLSALIRNWKKQEQGQEVTFDFRCCSPR